MSKEAADKAVSITVFLANHKDDYEDEIGYVLKNKWSGLVLSEADWKKKIDGFLHKEVN